MMQRSSSCMTLSYSMGLVSPWLIPPKKNCFGYRWTVESMMKIDATVDVVVDVDDDDVEAATLVMSPACTFR